MSFTKGEGFGRPLMEAAITGKPVIVSNWSGHVDFIKPEYNVLLGGNLKSVHPSPLSAYNGFFGCKHFSKTNKFLKQNNIGEIIW